ncbi:matrix metalloproteinase-25 [Chanos chanos]|uniref:Matrix metalloproteinase-25 n=1 Tax=Chanos chanos TaxID=29144 RepID=A0A6J2VFM8_CHACN|nr:matrix metalloproteinase-25-like [Chanos chanos]
MQRFGGLKETGKLDRDTLRLMEMPRCSLPDIVGVEDMLRRRRRRRRKRYALSGLRWEKTELTWSLQNYPSISKSLNQDNIERILTKAFKVWSDISMLQFHALPATAHNEADLRISFKSSLHEDGYPFDGKGGTLAHAFFPGEAEIAGDTHFDDQETWSISDGDDSIDLFTVAVHEFGHALGLSHSSTDPSIMRPYYLGPVGNMDTYQLPQDDRQAIQTLYGIKGGVTAPPGGSSPPLPNPHPTRVILQPDPSSRERCEGGFDAVADIRGDVFFFKGIHFWRIQRSGSLVSFAPALITNFWIGLPRNLQKIDAVYERKTDSHIIFFIGSQYWVFKDNVALPDYPRPLLDWGMKSADGTEVNKVEAAFVWAHNGKTYLFSGRRFWRFTEGQGGTAPKPEGGYPKNSSLWKGVPDNPDDIITWGEGDTYFFKNNSYWVLRRGGLDQDVVSARSTAVDWMFCPVPPSSKPTNPRAGSGDCSCAFSRASKFRNSTWLILLSFSFVF